MRKILRRALALWRSRLIVLLLSLVGILLINLYHPPRRPLSPPGDISAQGRTGCRLDQVLDGDTVIARCAGQRIHIRLLGIDAPEIGQKPWGMRAKRALHALLPQRFVLEAAGKDVYGRRLGTLWARGRDVNLEMIRRGQAVAYHSETTPQTYYAAQADAREAAHGIWAQPGTQRDPKRWRRYHR